jgi:hypothetical protein
MCTSPARKFCFPITYWMCEEADIYCSSSPGGQRPEADCCGPRGEHCCIDCFYCISPLAMVADVLCFSCNMYDRYLECQETREEQERRAAAI